MKVISISTDRKLFEKESAVLARNIDYASKMEGLYIIVFSLKKLGLKPFSIGNLFIYPTNSSSRLLYISDALRTGKRIVSHWKFVISHSQDFIISTQDPFETGLVGYFLQRKFDFPLQLQVHTDFLSPYFGHSFLNKIRKLIANYIIPKASGLRVVNDSIKSSIIKKFLNLKINPEVLPVFVDIEKIINTEPTKNIKADFPRFEFVIFMASRLTKEKRLDIALRVFKKITNLYPQVGLVIAGDGTERVKLEHLTKELKLTEKVVFVGWQNDLISYYKTADLFLLTSEFEGYGMTLIEAGASGCPIVTTQVGIASTSLFMNGENSFVCPVDDSERIFKSVLELLKNTEKRKLFKKEMQDSIKKIATTKEEYVEKYVSLLQNLIQK